MKKLLFGVLSVALLVGAVGCSTADKSNKNTLTVSTFNIDAKAQPDVKAQSKYLSDQGVEISGLQEVDNNTRRNSYDVVKKFKEGSFKDAFYTNCISYEGGEYGIAIVSKFKLKDTGFTELYSDLFAGEDVANELRAAYKNYDSENTESAAAMDAVSEKDPVEPRVFQRVVIEKDGKEIAFYNTHLSWENMDLRKQQIETIKKALDDDSVEYKIVVGDFNVDQSTKELDMFKKDYRLANGKDGKWIDTYTGVDDTMKVNSVDNIIVSKNIKIKTVKAPASGLSDHNPLIAELELK